MRLWKGKKQQVVKSSTRPHWNNADECPAKAFFKAQDDIRFLYKDWNSEITAELHESWKRINEQIIDEFGVDPSVQVQMLKERELLLNITKYYLENDRSLETRIEINKRQLEQMKKGTVTKQNPEKLAAELSVFYKMHIDLNNISILRFMYLIKGTQKNG